MKRLLLTILALVAMTAGVQQVKAQEAYAVLENTTLKFYYDSQKASRNGMSLVPLEYNNGATNAPWYSMSSNIFYVDFDASFANYRPTSTAYWFCALPEILRIDGMENLKTDNVTDMRGMFYGCSRPTSLDVSHFNTAKVTTMKDMFHGCFSLTNLDVSHFNTANVTDMGGMFHSCRHLTNLDVSHFNTAKVTTMEFLFCGCNSLTNINLKSFNTSKVESMLDMFVSCTNLTSLDISNFNTEKVTNMSDMFHDCTNLTSLDISNFNTTNVTGMYRMFGGCSSLTSLDLSNFNTSNVKDMKLLFSDCTSLKTIYASNWNVNANSGYNMFLGCVSLVGGNGTTYDSNHIDNEYARIDKPGQPGYFTASDEPTTYDLWIAGIQVTEQNKDNLAELVAELSEEAMERYFEGDMEITYDDASQTLTLKNAIIYAATGYGIQSKLSSPKIKLIGENTITADNGMGVRLQPGTEASDGAIISGGGSLNIKATGVGLRSHLNLFLTDGVKITSEGDAIGFQGWKATSMDDPLANLTMTGSETMLRTKGKTEGSLVSFAELNLQDDIRIMQPSGATFVPERGIVKDNLLVNDEWVLIAKPANGDANLDGVIDIADVVAVLNAMANDSDAPQFNVNGDSAVDIADVVAVLNIMAQQ